MAFCLAALVVVLDQLTKQWVLGTLVSPGASMALPGPIDFTLVMNRSNAFGLMPVAGEFSRWGLTFTNVAVALGLSAAIVRGTQHPLLATGFAFVIAGAIGNAIDRARLGAVIDFIDASDIGFVWIFNVADMALDLGIGFIILNWAVSNRRGQGTAA